MQSKVYAVQCLTNLHMGSGDINFNVIDNEVQRDPVLNTPAMFASGVKGALRDHFEALAADKVTDIFGSSIGDSREGKRDKSKPGSLKFLGGTLLLQPVRAAKGPGTYFLITTRQLLLNWAESYKTFKGKELENGLLQAVADNYGPVYEMAVPTGIEEYVEKYHSYNYIYNRISPYTVMIHDYYNFGEVQLYADIDKGVIKKVDIFTDALDSEIVEKLHRMLDGMPVDDINFKRRLAVTFDKEYHRDMARLYLAIKKYCYR